MGGFMVYDGEKPVHVAFYDPSPDLERIDSRFILSQWSIPRINEQDIQDKSKSDALSKVIALFQVAWFLLQLLARYCEKLAVTELEILTLAFCALNFAIYALWWKKPFAVDRSYAIRWKDDEWELLPPPSPPFVKPARDPFYRPFLEWMREPKRGIDRFAKMLIEAPSSVMQVLYLRITYGDTMVHDSGQRVSTFSPRMMQLGYRMAAIYYLSGSILILMFGSIHFLAWSVGPTSADRWAWRACTICVTVLPMTVFSIGSYVVPLTRISWIITLLFKWTLRVIPLLYLLARLGLFVLVFKSLVNCPPSALVAISWPQLVPHI
ncbi:hypothetical protein NLI96_g3188 [Meripilus lineatus]|uniref:Uncharacterized protein n=1 Tax=Meripilus lineatus TaxID=2056292 RepID=A0AAD5V7B7_9APHY|nr:hypothetical protein NLI96_g3188 [Physisporinus lineatus]